MTQVPPSPMIFVDDEKNPNLYGAEAVTVAEGDAVSSDADDALMLAGTHAHHFDEKYNQRLLRKIVSHLELNDCKSTM